MGAGRGTDQSIGHVDLLENRWRQNLPVEFDTDLIEGRDQIAQAHSQHHRLDSSQLVPVVQPVGQVEGHPDRAADPDFPGQRLGAAGKPVQGIIGPAVGMGQVDLVGGFQQFRMPQRPQCFVLLSRPGPSVGSKEVVSDSESVHSLVPGVGRAGPDHGGCAVSSQGPAQAIVKDGVDAASASSRQLHHGAQVHILIQPFLLALAALAEQAVHQFFRYPGGDLVSTQRPGLRMSRDASVDALGPSLASPGFVGHLAQLPQPPGHDRGQLANLAEAAKGHSPGQVQLDAVRFVPGQQFLEEQKALAPHLRVQEIEPVLYRGHASIGKTQGVRRPRVRVLPHLKRGIVHGKGGLASQALVFLPSPALHAHPGTGDHEQARLVATITQDLQGVVSVPDELPQDLCGPVPDVVSPLLDLISPKLADLAVV